jgi:hypothetical protein
MRGIKIVFGVATLLFALAAWSGPAIAADKNKCGCYKNASGTCFCDKKAKCGCPGDCEPKGCEAAREKALQREIEAETKRAAEADRKHAATGGGKSGTGAKSGTEKLSADKGSSGGEGRSGGDAVKPSAAKKMTAAQTKQLVKLLDAYFEENPDARSRNVEEVRNQLSQSR